MSNITPSWELAALLKGFAQAADPKRAQYGIFESFGAIFWVREGFRIVYGCDWIHLD